MHIYRLSDCEWYMAPSLDEAITASINLTGCTRAEVEEYLDGSREPLTDAQLDTLRFIDADEPGTEEPPEGWPSRTFREELALRVAAGCGAEVFASTEW
jgi:hypothetical protein